MLFYSDFKLKKLPQEDVKEKGHKRKQSKVSKCVIMDTDLTVAELTQTLRLSDDCAFPARKG